MDSLDHLIPKIKRNLKKFDKPGVLFVRPGFCVEKKWLSKEEAIVAVTSRKAKKVKLPKEIEGTAVDVRKATELEQFTHDKPDQFSELADHRTELRGTSLLPEFDPSTGKVKPPISAKVTASRQKKTPLQYKSPNPNPNPAKGKIPIICHVSPDAGWSKLQDFISGTQHQLKVSMYDFTSDHILELFETSLKTKSVLMTLDDPPRNPHFDQTDPQTIDDLKGAFGAKFSSAWALVDSSPEADSWFFPSAYHIKVMVRDGDTVWLSSGNLNNSNQPEIDPINKPQPGDQKTAKQSDRDWHVIIQSKDLAATFETYLDFDLQQAKLNAASAAVAAAAKKRSLQKPKVPVTPKSAIGTFTFAKPLPLNEQVTITPLITPDPGIYQPAILNLIKSVQDSLYIQLQYIHPTKDITKAAFTDLIDAVKAKIDAKKDVKIILSEFQTMKGGLDALQAAGIDLKHVKIQNNVHNKGFVFDHKVVVISSMNWSGEGVLSNRDAGVIIENANAAAYFEKIFLDDWAHHSKQQLV